MELLKMRVSGLLSLCLLIQVRNSLQGCKEFRLPKENFSLCKCNAVALKFVCDEIKSNETLKWTIKPKECPAPTRSKPKPTCSYNYPKEVDISEWQSQKILDANLLKGLPLGYRHYVLTLGITSSKFSGVDSLTFSAYKNLQDLFLGGNEIATLGRGVFSNLSALEYLDLSANKLESIDAKIFLTDKIIETLRLTGNKINHLDGDSFYHLPKVAKIYLRKNNISNISSLSFRRQTALSFLDLAENSIEMIEEGAFNNVTNLEEIYLEYNRINSIPKGLFQTQKKLKIVNLSNNPIITFFPLNQIIGHTISLKKINFNNISQSQLILENLNASSLKFFSAIYNNISKIPFKAFALTSSLEFLDLSFNHINYVDNNALGQLLKLLTLKLNNNNIETLFSGTFTFLKALAELDLAYNKISSFPVGLFESCSNLSTLRLSHNRLNHLSKLNFVPLKNLKTLQIDNNALTQLDSVSSLPKLQHISLQNNSWKCEELFNLIEKLESEFVYITETRLEPKVGHHIKQISCDPKELTRETEKPEVNIYEKSLKNMSLLFDKLTRNMDNYLNESQNISRFNNEEMLHNFENITRKFDHFTNYSSEILTDNLAKSMDKFLKESESISNQFTNVSSEILAYLQTAHDNASFSNEALRATFETLLKNASLSNYKSRDEFESEIKLTIEKYFESMSYALKSISTDNSDSNQEDMKEMIKDILKKSNNDLFSYIFLGMGVCLLFVTMGVFIVLCKQKSRREIKKDCNMLKIIPNDTL